MSRLVVFKGRAHHLPNDSMKADPVPGIWYVGERPQHIPESVPCFTELVFDKALAEQCGRTCGPDCDGDCFAEMYAGIGPSSNDPRNRKRDADLFDCLPWSPASEPEPSIAEALAHITENTGATGEALTHLHQSLALVADPQSTEPTASVSTDDPTPTDNPLKTSGTAAEE